MNLFDPLLGVAPASLIVISVDSELCEKLYPSSTPILKVLASVPFPLKSPVPALEPSEVTEETPSASQSKPVPLPVVALCAKPAPSLIPVPLKLFGSAIDVTPPLPLTVFTITFTPLDKVRTSPTACPEPAVIASTLNNEPPLACIPLPDDTNTLVFLDRFKAILLISYNL